MEPKLVSLDTHDDLPIGDTVLSPTVTNETATDLIENQMDTIENDIKIVIEKTPYTIVKEGSAEILFPSSHDVFYNPVQEFNRDISVAVIKEFINGNWNQKRLNGNTVEVVKKEIKRQQYEEIKEIRLLEALSASGLRSIRYVKEINNEMLKIVANDASTQAFESIQRNIVHNKVEGKVKASLCDASLLMYQHRVQNEQFHIIDLDPYGSPTQFLDAAAQSIKDGGLLMVTCTDLAVLCGNSPETCHAKYGSVALKNKCCHEMALRIVLRCIESHCNRYGRYIIPFLSISVDFYVRLFVQVWTSPFIVKQSSSKLAMVYQCVGCETLNLQPLGKVDTKPNGVNSYQNAHGPPVLDKCQHCGGKHRLGGPIWTPAMHNPVFIEELLTTLEKEEKSYTTIKRMNGILTLISEELNDCPLHYTMDRMCSTIHIPMPQLVSFRSAILNAGYKVSMSHTATNSIKTNAPAAFVWDVIRKWTKANPPKRDFKEGSYAHTILNQEPKFDISFEIHADANPVSREQNLLRFQMNPKPHWGPKMRSQTSLWCDKPLEKQLRFQNKKKRPENELKTDQDLKYLKCKKSRKGKCDLGEDCKYSHEET